MSARLYATLVRLGFAIFPTAWKARVIRRRLRQIDIYTLGKLNDILIA